MDKDLIFILFKKQNNLSQNIIPVINFITLLKLRRYKSNELANGLPGVTVNS
jgi:hypothetical protein